LREPITRPILQTRTGLCTKKNWITSTMSFWSLIINPKKEQNSAFETECLALSLKISVLLEPARDPFSSSSFFTLELVIVARHHTWYAIRRPLHTCHLGQQIITRTHHDAAHLGLDSTTHRHTWLLFLVVSSPLLLHLALTLFFAYAFISLWIGVLVLGENSCFVMLIYKL